MHAKKIARLYDLSLIHILLFLILLFCSLGSGQVRITWLCLMTPVLLVMLALLAIGTGMILASLTAKYRDLQVLVGFGIQLWMYASPIVYPLSQIPGKWRILLSLNPVAYIVAVSYTHLSRWWQSEALTAATFFC